MWIAFYYYYSLVTWFNCVEIEINTGVSYFTLSYVLLCNKFVLVKHKHTLAALGIVTSNYVVVSKELLVLN